MNNTHKRDFIPKLLITVVIFGIVVAATLVLLNEMRNKKADTLAASLLKGARAQSELYYDNNHSYTTVCTEGEGNIASHLMNAKNAVEAGAVCFDESSSWAASIDLNGTGEKNFYCVDSTGFDGVLPNDPVLADGNTTCL